MRVDAKVLTICSVPTSKPRRPSPGRSSKLPASRCSKKRGEVEQPEKSEKQREHHGKECVQSVRTDQNSRSDRWCHGFGIPHRCSRTEKFQRGLRDSWL